ncbi:hypothetical protein C4571_00830 [Candidatus Parcubacteria bacterium]|nr:MAG: hypothetical protein C4571_00830 [Candidatus Parcubacteria bacterium]
MPTLPQAGQRPNGAHQLHSRSETVFEEPGFLGYFRRLAIARLLFWKITSFFIIQKENGATSKGRAAV